MNGLLTITRSQEPNRPISDLLHYIDEWMDGWISLRKEREEYGSWSCPPSQGRDTAVGDGRRITGGESRKKETKVIRDSAKEREH